jgi:predicted O-methyltransferase YrrM
MSEQQWTAVDRYINDRLVGPDAALDRALENSATAGLPPIAVSPAQGKLLHLLALALRVRTILELGTLGGYSTIWLARALPTDGRLVTLEADPHYAEVARANIAYAELSDIVDLRVGRALDTLPQLAAEAPEPFDLIFIDADKRSTPDYFEWALELSRPGSVIVTDNVIRDGALIDAGSDDPGVQGAQRFHERLAADRRGEQRVSATTIQTVGNRRGEQRVSATTIQTVGSKGYDGFTLALVMPTGAGGDGVAAGDR